MDPNTDLLLAKAGQPPRWEDEEKATNDVEQLREEFRRRLYGSGCAETSTEQKNGPAGAEAR
jgi:hypothetical protein